MSILKYKNKKNETKELSQVTIATVTKEQIIDTVYPVGSIYTSVNPIDPATLWGIGTWVEWGSGRVPVGVKSDDSNFNSVEKEGGSYTVSLSKSQLPSHNHTYDKSDSTTENHILTTSEIPSHSHTYDKVNSTTENHTLTVDEMPSHTHTFTGTSHSHSYDRGGNALVVYSDFHLDSMGGTDLGYQPSSNLSWFCGAKKNVSGISGTTAGGTNSNVGGSNGHNHNIKTTSTNTGSNGSSSAHNHNITLTSTNTSSIGSGNAHNNIQPYITCYMWKRIG